MTLSELKKHLSHITELTFQMPDGSLVPKHFHVTEVGQINKKFIDCGGTVRNETTISLQLWEDGDLDHRLLPEKLKEIISLSEKILGIEDGDIEVEYQRETIGKYGLEFNGNNFRLTYKKTACLAEEQCRNPNEKQKISLSDLSTRNQTSCKPGSGCC